MQHLMFNAMEMDGVQLTPLTRVHTDKGDILHVLKSIDSNYVGFGEAYFSEVYEGVRKGWKRHNKITLNLVVAVGAIKFTIYDDRKGSHTEGQFFSVVLSPQDNYCRLTLSPGLWMSFEGVGRGTSLLLDIIPEPHDPDEADRMPLDVFQD